MDNKILSCEYKSNTFKKKKQKKNRLHNNSEEKAHKVRILRYYPGGISFERVFTTM